MMLNVTRRRFDQSAKQLVVGHATIINVTLSFTDMFCRFFIEIASDCETLDTSNHSLSFISDANVVALHRLLWINQEKIGDYLSSSRDHKAVGRRPFDKMAMLLAYLGPPEHRPLDSQYVTD